MNKFNNIIFGLLFVNVVFICSCGLFSKGKHETHLTDSIHLLIEQNETSTEPEYHQIITLSKESVWLTLDDDTRTAPIDFHFDSLPIDGKDTPMIFIYDMYLGWAIVFEESLEIHKDFSELPKEQALLTKLRMMEEPDLSFDGEGFIRKE